MKELSPFNAHVIPNPNPIPNQQNSIYKTHLTPSHNILTNRQLTMSSFRGLTLIQLLKLTFFLLLTLTLALHSLLSSPITNNTHLLFSLLYLSLISILSYIFTRPRPVLLLDYSCFLPNSDQKCSYEVAGYFVRRSNRFTQRSEEFMHGIYLKSGLGDETYVPPFIFQKDYEAKHESAIQEAREGIVLSVDSLLSKTRFDISLVDTVIVTCGMFSPVPSLTSMLCNHYNFAEDVKTYNLSGMGCSSGVSAIDLASRLLNSSRKIGYILVVVTESITLNWYED